MRHRGVLAAASVASLSILVADVASAGCTRLAFTVNDFGKDGPTKDAKDLLDKHAAKWAAARGIKGHTVGPKAVACKLFLVIPEEYTCTALANVCWGGSVAGTVPQQDVMVEPPDAPAGAKSATVAPAAAKAPTAAAGQAPSTTGSVVRSAPPAGSPKAAPAAARAAAPVVVAPAAAAASVMPQLPAAAAPAAAAPAPAAAAPTTN